MLTGAPERVTAPTARLMGVIRRSVASRWAPVWLGVVAMIISLPGIGTPSKWSDEAATTTLANRTFVDLWRTLNNIDAVHGFYYALMHVWVDVLGTSATVMRLLSLIGIGIAAAGVAQLGRRLGGTNLMIAGALAFAVLPRVTWMGIEARSYALTVAAATWATVLLLHALRRWSPARWLLYAVLTWVGIALNIYLALMLAAHAVTVLWSWRRIEHPGKSMTGLVLAGTIAVICALPIVILALGQTEQIAISDLTPAYAFNMLGIEQYFTGATPIRNRLVPLPPATPWAWGAVLLAVIGWLLVVCGALGSRRLRPLEAASGGSSSGAAGLDVSDSDVAASRDAASDAAASGAPEPLESEPLESEPLQSEPLEVASREREPRHPSLAAVAVPWIAVPTLLVLGYSLFSSNLYSARYFSFTASAAAMLIGAGLLSIRGRPLRLGAAALVVLLALPVYVYQRIPTGKQGTDWKQAVSVVERYKQDGDRVYWGTQYGNDAPGANISRIGHAYPEVFDDIPSITRGTSAAESATLWGPDRLLSQSTRRVDNAPRIWVFSDHLGNPDFHTARGTTILERHGMRLERTWEGVGTDVFLWVRD